MAGNLELRTINELLGLDFIIPDYQRGYRWTEQQVVDLLDDLQNFRKNRKENEFYCLQPIVVKKSVRDPNPNCWEVIDGQQRLTTIYIIIKYLINRDKIDNFAKEYGGKDEKDLYTIDYVTRKESKEFLENIYSRTDNTIPDFHYMVEAYQTVQRWFDDKGRQERNLISDTILGNDADNKQPICKVIWYEVDAESNGADMFARLNIGKIPLTNSELVKALFLSESSGLNASEKIEVALLWDEMEQQLHQEDFWAFVTNEKADDYPNRIELLFDIIAGKEDKEKNSVFFTFRYFVEKLKEAKKPGGNQKGLWDVWLAIEHYYQTIREWYNSPTLYHRIGYLIAVEEDKGRKVLKELLRESEESEKPGFTNTIQKKIIETVKDVSKLGNRDIEELQYDNNRDKSIISNLLLLFNVESVRKQKDKAKYSFKDHHSEKWSLEHIHAQNSDAFDDNKKDAWTLWLEEHQQTLVFFATRKNRDHEGQQEQEDIDDLSTKAQDLCVEVKIFLEKKKALQTREEFNSIYKQIVKLFSDPKDEESSDFLHGIGNLALLSQTENSALSNSVFEVKRRKLIEMDKNGEYIPTCTRRVFLKYYTQDTSKTQIFFWGKQDREDYVKAIRDVLEEFLTKQEVMEGIQ